MSIKHWPPHERPREKLFVRGAQYLSDAELIALFLKQGAKGRNAVEVARAALSGAGGLRAFLELDVPGMHGISGFGPASIAALKACLELGSRYLEARARRGDALRNPGDTRSFVRARLCGYPYEVFACLLLDNRHRIIRYEELFRGTIDGASVPPREVVRYALQHNAAAVIFPQPSIRRQRAEPRRSAAHRPPAPGTCPARHSGPRPPRRG